MVFSSDLYASIRNNNLEEFKSVLASENITDINAQSTSTNLFYSTGKGHSLLHVAIKANAIDIVKFLLEEKKANPDKRDGSGEPPLILAVYNITADQTDIVEILLKSGADPNCKDTRLHPEATPLWSAAQLGKINTVKMLLARGADLTMRPKDENSAWNVAYNRGHVTLSALLKPLGSDKKNAGENHLNYLLKSGYALEELPYILKKPYTKFCESCFIYYKSLCDCK